MWSNEVCFAHICFVIFLKNDGELKKPAYCTDSSLGGPFFSSHPVNQDLINANTSKFVKIKKDYQIANYLIIITIKASYQKGSKG